MSPPEDLIKLLVSANVTLLRNRVSVYGMEFG